MTGMTDAEIEALALSLEVALRSVLFSLPVAIATAWLLTRRRFAGRTLLDAFVHLPMVLPPVMVGYVLLLLFGVRGPIGHWLYQSFGIRMAFTTRGAALATAVMSFPLMVRAIRLSLENVDRGLEEAAAPWVPARSIAGAPSPCRSWPRASSPARSPRWSQASVNLAPSLLLPATFRAPRARCPSPCIRHYKRPTAMRLRHALRSSASCSGMAGLFAAELLARSLRRRLGR